MESPQKTDDQPSIQIHIPETLESGQYANLAISNYSQEEFMLDFVFLHLQQGRGKLLSRIVLSPRNAKRIAQLLQINIADYEAKFGKISHDESQNNAGIKLNFN